MEPVAAFVEFSKDTRSLQNNPIRDFLVSVMVEMVLIRLRVFWEIVSGSLLKSDSVYGRMAGTRIGAY